MIPPHAYRVEQRRQHCTACGQTHSFSTLYSVATVGPRCDRLTPITKPHDVVWNLPVEHTFAPTETIPFCHACYYRVDLRGKPVPEPVVEGAATGAQGRTYTHATTVRGGYAAESESPLGHKPKDTKPRKPKPVYTVDDLLA